MAKRRRSRGRSRRQNPKLSWPVLIMSLVGGAIVGAVAMHFGMHRKGYASNPMLTSMSRTADCDFTMNGYCCNKASDGNYHCINAQGYIKILPPPPKPPFRENRSR